MTATSSSYSGEEEIKLNINSIKLKTLIKSVAQIFNRDNAFPSQTS